jgi:hypothetical protein
LSFASELASGRLVLQAGVEAALWWCVFTQASASVGKARVERLCPDASSEAPPAPGAHTENLCLRAGLRTDPALHRSPFRVQTSMATGWSEHVVVVTCRMQGAITRQTFVCAARRGMHRWRSLKSLYNTLTAIAKQTHVFSDMREILRQRLPTQPAGWCGLHGAFALTPCTGSLATLCSQKIRTALCLDLL